MISSNDEKGPRGADWLQPTGEQEGLGRYLEIIRERIGTIVVAIAITLTIAIAYVATATKVYEAEADLLITPVPAEDPILAGLGLIRESSDPTRDVETAARLATTIEVAERVRETLALSEDARDLVGDVTAEPIALSNLVALTASSDDPDEAARLANGFAEAAVAERTEALHDQIEELLPELESRADDEGGGTSTFGDQPLDVQIARLETLLESPDPTVRAETEAIPPESAVSPRPLLTVTGALFAGLVLGIGGAFAMQTLDPRLRREQQLRARYRLPVLARVPRERDPGKGPLAPDRVSTTTTEAFRSLRASVIAAGRHTGGPQAILVTGSSNAEGKTTTAINLAASLALAGKRTILIEADLRRPAIGPALGVHAESGGIVGVLLESASLEGALVQVPAFGANLEVLLADHEGGWISELFSLAAAQRMVEDAKRRADFVVIDSPPLTAVVDTLPLAAMVDEVLIVTRIGVTRLDRLQELGELLAGNDIAPLGFALLAAPKPEGPDYLAGPQTDAAGRNGRDRSSRSRAATR
ncbi:MAG: AAA family ATPase [Solirubrobacterales bacterium]